jgi:hypothetical protein
MRAYEPSFTVSASGSDSDSDVDGAKVNFTNEHLSRLAKIEALFMPRIVKGFIQGKGWQYAVAIRGQAHISPSFEALQAKVEAHWVEFFDNARPSDFDHCIKIQAAIKDAAGFDWV